MNGCCKADKECKFVISVIDSLQKLLAYMNTGKYGELYSSIVFQDKVEQTQTITLNETGYMMFLYVKAFKEQFPIEPYTSEQIEKINAIWDALGIPEKKIAV